MSWMGVSGKPDGPKASRCHSYRHARRGNIHSVGFGSRIAGGKLWIVPSGDLAKKNVDVSLAG